MKGYLFLLLGLLTAQTVALVSPIPREAKQNFVNRGIFEGGTSASAEIANLRMGKHKGFERWVLDFANPVNKALGQIAPPFTVRYARAQQGLNKDGKPALIQPPRLLINLRNIKQNNVARKKIQKLIKQSSLVQDVLFYPPIENGDRTIELILKQSIYFEPHQPKQKVGRLVLDLRSAPRE